MSRSRAAGAAVLVGMVLAGAVGSAPAFGAPAQTQRVPAFCFSDGDIPARLLIRPVRADLCPIVGRVVVGTHGGGVTVPPPGESVAVSLCGVKRSVTVGVTHDDGWIRAFES